MAADGSAAGVAGVSGDESDRQQIIRRNDMKRRGRRYAGTIVFGLLLFGFANAAVAQQPTQAQTNAIKQSCRSDYQSYCASVPTGGRASLQCLQEHLTDLSASCQTAVSAVSGADPSGARQAGGGQAHPPAASQGAPPAMSMRDEMALMRRSCGGDFRAYCRGVQPGGGRGLACLSENQARLSPPCRGALAEARGSR
jgi:hypothetical protein